MKKTIELNILGQRITVQSEESEEYVRRVEECFESKIAEVRENTKAVATLDTALLAALNVTGELIRTKQLLKAIEKRSDDLTEMISRRLG